MPELNPEQIAALRKLEEQKREALRAEHGDHFRRADIEKLIKKVEEAKRPYDSAERRSTRAWVWWNGVVETLRNFPVRMAYAGAAAIAVFIALIVILIGPSSGYKTLALVSARGGTNSIQKLNSMLQLTPNAGGPTNNASVLLANFDFKHLVVHFKLRDSSEIKGSLTPLPVSEPESMPFELSAKGTNSFSEPLEIKGVLTARTRKPVVSPTELRWKNIISISLSLRAPGEGEFISLQGRPR